MKIHVCLVSDQILANLIPALMERPDKVILVATREMVRRGQAERLQQALSRHGIPSESVDAAPDGSLAEIRRYGAALAAALAESTPGVSMTLNATGGNKLMMLGFVEVFRAREARIIYADTANRRIEDIGSEKLEAMTDVLDVPGYLAAQGMTFDRADSDDPHRVADIERRASLTRFIGEHAPALQAGINIMNGILSKAVERDKASREDQLVKPEFELTKGAWRDFAEMLDRCAKLGLVEWTRGAKTGRFADIDAARYLHGIWLEEYAWLCARECRPFDVRMGVHRSGRDEEEINEFDLLAVQGNHLLFVECKTANFLYKLGQANEVAYKLDSLGRRARGLFGETWLLSAIEPPPEMLDRTRDLRIRVVGPKELPMLAKEIETWAKG